MKFIQWWPVRGNIYSVLDSVDFIPGPCWNWLNPIPDNYDIVFYTLYGKRYLRRGDFLILNKDNTLFQDGKYLPDK